MTTLDRFWGKVSPEPNSGCWLWDGAANTRGYGNFWVDGKYLCAHRFSYELHKGQIPTELELDHLCRVSCCVNPDHLEPVTHQENLSRAGWALRTHCKRGHLIDESTTYRWRGSRQCRICIRRASEARRARKVTSLSQAQQDAATLAVKAVLADARDATGDVELGAPFVAHVLQRMAESPKTLKVLGLNGRGWKAENILRRAAAILSSTGEAGE